ncbi:MAG TPA: M12 family metallo-peptidase [Thermoanaerobaculia bacterium]|jgi:hypothetical protein|nr:M12 family metallo-peptidase [Thermoanaerobaculia bacterium]
MHKVSRRFVVSAALVVATVAFPSFAGTARQLDRRIGQVLKSMPADGSAVLRDISLGRESLDALEIEPMEVWAKDAKIVAYGAAGQETLISPPDVKYFKGRVVGEDDSIVFFSRSANGAIRGMVILGDRQFAIGTGIRRGTHREARKDLGEGVIEPDAPLLISEVSSAEIEADDVAVDETGEFECAIAEMTSEIGKRPAQKYPVTGEAGNVTGATYQLRIAVETDNELSAAFSNNAGNITTYIGDLIAKSSIVYSRDLKTALVVGHVNIRNGGPGTDPWAGTGFSDQALAEFGTYWHNNYSLGYPDPDGGGAGTAGGGVAVQRSSAVFLSGRNMGAGIAWLDVLCNDNFFCGTTGVNCGSATYANSYAGGYAFNSSSGAVSTTTPDPEATVNGVQYGIPNSNFWMLLEVMHELGHNVASPHSSCIALSPAEQITYGVVGRNWVDQCLNSGAGSGCYAGSTSAPAEKGTIMSYCHNITVSGFRASRYLFGKAGEPSEKMLPVLKYGQALDVNSPSGLEGCTPNATITTQSEPVSCSAGRTASVATCSGCTYSWTIAGGTITSSTTTAAITYTPNTTNVILTATIIGPRGCGITSSKAILSSCTPVSAPTNVVATATSTASVNITWTASVGATTYNVYRSPDALNYTLAGSSATTNFADGGRTANTAYLYKVRAVAGTESGDSNIDLATTTIFTDDPLVAGTPVKAVHITQLRTAVNAVRTLASLGAGSYTDPSLAVGVTGIKAVHINDLRTALNQARSALALSAVSYGETVAAGVSIKTSHITELRNGVK